MHRIKIQHLTRYHYSEPVILLPHTLHLRPRDGFDIRVHTSSLKINHEFQIRWKRDVYSNSVAIINFLEPARELVISSEVVIEHYEEQALNFVLEDNAQRFPFQYSPSEQVDLAPYQTAIFPQDQNIIKDWIADITGSGDDTDTIAMLTSINRKIANELEYQMREEPGVQSPAQTLLTGRGSCRDFATLFIEICRYCGFACRFISGYALNESMNEGHTSTHAWSEIYLPGSGWRGFDSTSGLVVSGDHIPVAVHRHPQAIPPVSGSFVGAENIQHELYVEVHVKLMPASPD